MSKRLKMFIIVCIGFIVIGICLASIGLLLGATGNINLNHISWNLSDSERSFHVGKKTPESQAGFSGQIETDSMQVNEPVQVIKTKVGIGEIQFIESDKFEVKYTYDKGFGKPEVKISDGALTIIDKFGKGGVDLGMKKWSSFNDNEGISYKIYYPKGTKFELIELNNNLGDINVSDVETGTLNIKLDVGEVKLFAVIVGDADVSLSLGNIKMENVQTNNLSANISMGDIAIHGSLKGQNKVVSDMGDIKVETSLEKDQYSLNLDAQLGDIKVNGEKIGGSYQVNNNSSNIIDARTSAGDIKVQCK